MPIKIEPRTDYFIEALQRLKADKKLPTNATLANLLDIKSETTISEIKGRRQNIQPKAWEKFKEYFGFKDSDFSDSRGTSVEDAKEITAQEFIKILNRILDFAEKLSEAKDQTIQILKENVNVNLNDLSKGQLTLLSQIRAASRLDVIRSAGNDKKKLQQELDTLDKLVGEFSKEDEEKDTP
jgi:hypothetical protein